MSKSKKPKFVKTENYEIVRNLNKELETVAWLHLYHPTEQISWMGLPKEKWSLHLLNDPRYPIPRNLMAYENEPEKWDEVFQEAIVDRLHEMITAAFSNAANPYEEVILSPGEWEYSPMHQKLIGIVIFKLSQRCNFGEVAPRGTIRVNVSLPKITANYTSDFDIMRMANKIPGLKKGYPDLFSDDSNPIQMGEKLTAPYGDKRLPSLDKEPKTEPENYEAMTEKLLSNVESLPGFYDQYPCTTVTDCGEYEVLQRIRAYLNLILPGNAALNALDFERYALVYPDSSISINGEEYKCSDLVRTYITNSTQSRYSDVVLDIIGRIWKTRFENCFRAWNQTIPVIDIFWTPSTVIGTEETTISMLAFIEYHEKIIEVIVSYVRTTGNPTIPEICISCNNEFPHESERRLARIKTEFIGSLYGSEIGIFKKAIIPIPHDAVYAEIINLLKSNWVKCFQDTFSYVVVTLTLRDDSEYVYPTKTEIIYVDYPLSAIDQLQNYYIFDLTINTHTGIIALREKLPDRTK